MVKARNGVFLYIVFAVMAVFVAGGYFFIEEEPAAYETAIHKMQYQVGYHEVYYIDANGAFSTTTAAQSDAVSSKVVYLTFDDGPSMRTVEILDILKEYGIKATFFILCDEKESSKEIIRRIYDEGHSIGVHSCSHDYEKIYHDVKSFLDDFEGCLEYIKDVTGEETGIFRFPGGSVNSYNKKICRELTDEMTRRGFTYFDWNVSSDDAVKGYTEESIYNNVINGCNKHNISVVLMHDSTPKNATVAALKRIIPALLEQGYTFERLDETAQPTVFKIE